MVVLDEDTGKWFGISAQSWVSSDLDHVAAGSNAEVHLRGAMTPRSRTIEVTAEHTANGGRMQVGGQSSWDMAVVLKYPPATTAPLATKQIVAQTVGPETIKVKWAARNMDLTGSESTSFNKSGTLSINVN